MAIEQVQMVMAREPDGDEEKQQVIIWDVEAIKFRGQVKVKDKVKNRDQLKVKVEIKDKVKEETDKLR